MSLESLFLQYSADKLRQFLERIEVCTGMLSHDQIWARTSENSNAIGNLILHLDGNVRQWIIGSLGGEAIERNRDAEFAAREGSNAEQLSAHLRRTVEHATRIIARLTTTQLTRTCEIQNYSVSGVEAVYHVVEHFAEHTGQIIFATKMMTGGDLGFYRNLANTAHGERVP